MVNAWFNGKRIVAENHSREAGFNFHLGGRGIHLEACTNKTNFAPLVVQDQAAHGREHRRNWGKIMRVFGIPSFLQVW
jgi:hypothetical protein